MVGENSARAFVPISRRRAPRDELTSATISGPVGPMVVSPSGSPQVCGAGQNESQYGVPLTDWSVESAHASSLVLIAEAVESARKDKPGRTERETANETAIVTLRENGEVFA